MTQPLLLLVDDSAEVAFIVSHSSRGLGLDIVSRADAELAWAFVQEQRPDLVLLDVHLPGASGIDLCRWLRAEPRLHDLPVALLSQWQRPEDIAQGLAAGADFVLSKDLFCRPEEWRQRLHEILTWTAGRRPPISLRWKANGSAAGQTIDQFNRLLRGPLAAQLGAEVVQALLARARSRVRTEEMVELAEDGLGLQMAGGHSEASTRSLQAAFAEQLWCMVGTAGCAPWLDALQAESQSLSECSPS